jgi:signal peptidase II
MTYLRSGLAIAAVTLILDQLSKWWILYELDLPARRNVPLFEIGQFGIDFTMVWNRGVTFGLLSGDSQWNQIMLAGLAAIIAAILLRWLWRAENGLVAIALGLVIGGAIGNIIDRFRFGAVVDFVDAFAYGWHWYVFNVADAGIVIGVGLLLIDALFRPSPKSRQAS